MTPAPQPQQEYITFTFYLGGRSVCGNGDRPDRCEDCSEMPNCILDCFYDELSRPHISAPVPNSHELSEMAKTEWLNREERRGIHNKEDWCSGWISGFLTPNKPDWTKEREATIRNTPAPEEKPCDHCDFQERDEREYNIAKQAATQSREKTLTDVMKALDDVVLIDENNQYYFWLGDVECAVESLRTEEKP